MPPAHGGPSLSPLLTVGTVTGHPVLFSLILSLGSLRYFNLVFVFSFFFFLSVCLVS